MSVKQPDVVAVNISITVTVPLDVIARIKNEYCHPATALNRVLTDVVNDITSAVKAIPYDISPTRDTKDDSPTSSSFGSVKNCPPPIHTPPPDEPITITIRGITTGREDNLRVCKSCKVQFIKKRMVYIMSIPPATQRLTGKGRRWVMGIDFANETERFKLIW